MIWQTFQTLFPVFAVIGLGYGLTRKGFLTNPFLEELNRLVYWVCLPSLIVANLDRASNLAEGSLSIIVVYFAATFCVMGSAFLVAHVLKLDAWQKGTFVQSSFRGNLAFIGIPILIYALRDQEAEMVSNIIAKAVFVFAPIMILYNVTSVMILLRGHQGENQAALPKTIRNIVTNPLVLAALSGLCLYLLPINLPVFVGDTLQFVGRTAAPMALICVGGGMALTSMEGRYRSATFSSILKVFATPLFAYLISLPFNLSETETLILMIFSATPTAVASYVMAKQLHGDGAMASGGIIISTLLSMISLSIVVSLF
jgi:predicted permease